MEANILCKPIFKPITLKNKLTIKSLILFQFFFVFFYSGVCELTGLPKTISYFVDVLNLILLVYMFCDRMKWKKLYSIKMNFIFFAILSMCILCLTTSLINRVKPQLVVWAVRNELRYFPFFLGSILYFTKDDAKSFIKVLFRLQILNVLVSVIQFFVYGIEQDNLGGIFGTSQGCNGLTNVYFCFLMTLAICYYLNHKMLFIKMILVVGSCLVIGAMAELKVLYAEFAIIVIMSLILCKKTLRTGVMIVTSVGGLIGSLMLFSIIFPDWLDHMTSILDYINIGSDTGGGYEISRLGAIEDINDIWFKGDFVSNLIGYGFGSCEYSTFDFFTSDFSRLYMEYHYSWFSFQKDFLETGFVGIISYALVIVFIFMWITKNKKIYKDKCGIGVFGQIYCVLMVIFFIYNSTLRTECGYMAYMFLTLPFMYYKSLILANKEERLCQSC